MPAALSRYLILCRHGLSLLSNWLHPARQQTETRTSSDSKSTKTRIEFRMSSAWLLFHDAMIFQRLPDRPLSPRPQPAVKLATSRQTANTSPSTTSVRAKCNPNIQRNPVTSCRIPSISCRTPAMSVFVANCSIVYAPTPYNTLNTRNATARRKAD